MAQYAIFLMVMEVVIGRKTGGTFLSLPKCYIDTWFTKKSQAKHPT